MVMEPSGFLLQGPLDHLKLLWLVFLAKGIRRRQGFLVVLFQKLPPDLFGHVVGKDPSRSSCVSELSLLKLPDKLVPDEEASWGDLEVQPPIEVYHPAVRVHQIFDDGSEVGIFHDDEGVGINSRVVLKLEDEPVHDCHKRFGVAVEEPPVGEDGDRPLPDGVPVGLVGVLLYFHAGHAHSRGVGQGEDIPVYAGGNWLDAEESSANDRLGFVDILHVHSNIIRIGIIL